MKSKSYQNRRLVFFHEFLDSSQIPSAGTREAYSDYCCSGGSQRRITCYRYYLSLYNFYEDYSAGKRISGHVHHRSVRDGERIGKKVFSKGNYLNHLILSYHYLMLRSQT